MMLQFLHDRIIPSAYSLLPLKMQNDRATAMILATCLQESKAEHRLQIIDSGPTDLYAHGFWQFERNGGVAEVLTNIRTRDHMMQVCDVLRYAPSRTDVWQAITHNDILACCCARLLLWTLPHALPSPEQTQVAYQQYLRAWKPGAPRPDDWPENYRRAWALVLQNPS